MATAKAEASNCKRIAISGDERQVAFGPPGSSHHHRTDDGLPSLLRGATGRERG